MKCTVPVSLGCSVQNAEAACGVKYEIHLKGLQRQPLIGSAVAGFNDARTITLAFVTGLDTRQDDYNKGICSPGSLVNNPVR